MGYFFIRMQQQKRFNKFVTQKPRNPFVKAAVTTCFSQNENGNNALFQRNNGCKMTDRKNERKPSGTNLLQTKLT